VPEDGVQSITFGFKCFFKLYSFRDVGDKSCEPLGVSLFVGDQADSDKRWKCASAGGLKLKFIRFCRFTLSAYSLIKSIEKLSKLFGLIKT